MTDRARLTPVDIVWFGSAIAILGFMATPMYGALRDNVGSLSTGDAYLFQIIFPTAVLTVVALVILTGMSGGMR